MLVRKVYCASCNRDITHLRHGAVYCGYKCRSAANNKIAKAERDAGIREKKLRTHHTVECDNCKTKFRQERSSQKYCTKECRKAARLRLLREERVRIYNNDINDLL